jgi:hypothetical protein
VMRTHNFPYSSSVCLVVSFVFLLCGCAGVTFNGAAPAPSPTPQAGPADRVLLQMGPAGTLYQEFAATDSGLNQVAGDITLPTRFLAIAPPIASVHGFLFALDSGPLPQIDAFTEDSVAGKFSSTAQFMLQPGPSIFSTDPSGNYLYVNESHDDPPNGYESNLNAFHIGADGGLTQVPGAPFIFFGGPGTGLDCCFNLGSRLAFTPDGTRAYAVTVEGCPCHSTGFWTVQPFLVDTNTGAITKEAPQPGAPPPSEFFIGGVVVAKNGKYLLFPSIDGLMVYSIDPSTGSLTPVKASSPLPATDIDHPYVEITATKDGEFVYLDQPQSGLLYGFHVENDGSLMPVPGSPYATGTLSSLTVSSSGRFVFASRVAQGFLAFKRDPNTGQLIEFDSVLLQQGVLAIVNLN